MADHSKPTVTSTYANYTSELDGRLDDLALGLDPATTSSTNVPTNAIRWASSSKKWQKWNGSSWGDLSVSYSININGTVGATTPAAGSFTNASYTGTLTGGTGVVNIGSGQVYKDASGNVGIGMSSPVHRLDATGAAGTFAGIRITGPAFQDAGFIANRPNSGNSASLYFTETGTNVAAIHSRGSSYGSGLSGALQIINGSKSLTLDSSGNLGLGVTPSAWSSGKAIEVGYLGDAIWGVNANEVNITKNAYFNSGWKYASTQTAARYQMQGGTHAWHTAPSGTAGNAISFTQAMTLDASGNLLVGVTAVVTDSTNVVNGGVSISGDGELRASKNDARAAMFKRTTSVGTVVDFYKDSSLTGSISVTATTTAYNTSSDYRLKEDWVAVADASTRVSSLKPVNFSWKADGSRVDGFLAHELAEVVPEAVTGAKDAVDADGKPVYQVVDQSKLVPLLTAALQEALAKIESLEARLDAANL